MPAGASQYIRSNTRELHEHHDFLVIASGERLAKMRARQEAALSINVPIRFQEIISISPVNDITFPNEETAVIIVGDGRELRTTPEVIHEFYAQLTDRIPGMDLIAFRRNNGVFNIGVQLNPSDRNITALTDDDIEREIGFEDTYIVTIKDERLIGEY